jgi:trimethylamine:corrinoid methyltransferase-like protein
VFGGNEDTAVNSAIDLFVDKNSFENWDLKGSKRGKNKAQRRKKRKERRMMQRLLKKKKTVKQMKASLPEENHDQDSRLLLGKDNI